MSRASPQENLTTAAALVLEVMGSLNAATVPCTCCGRLQPEDFVEHQAHQALMQMRVKLLDWADTLALPREQRADSPAAVRARQRRERVNRREETE